MKKSDEEKEKLILVNQQLKEEIRKIQETNRQLIEKQQFLYNILSSAPIVIWSIDLEGNFTYSQYQTASGLPLSENIGKSVFDVYKGTGAEIFVRKVLQGVTLSDVIDLNGISYDTRVSPIYDQNGIKTGYMGVSMDITEQLKVKKELEKFRHVLDQAPGAVMIMDKDFNFEYINPHFTRISGYTEEELLHRNISDTLYGGKIPDSRKEITASMAAGQTWQGELPTRNKDGSWYWANTLAAPFLDKNGNVDGFVIIQQDITEKKRLLLEMEEKEQLYRSLMEKSLDGIVISQDGKVIMVNQAFADMLDYSVDECMEVFGPESIVPEDRQRVLDIHYKRMKGDIGDMRYVAGIFRKDGTKVMAEFNTTSLEIKGKPASLVSTHDITHRLQIENALRESEEKYRSLIEKALDGILITQDGVFKFVNRSFCEMMQYPEEELLQLPFIRLVDEKHHAEMLENHKRRMLGENFQAIYRAELIRKDGSRIMVELNSRTTDFEGKSASFVITRDITDRLHTEEELRKAKEELEELNQNLEERVNESTLKLTEANTQLIRLQKENLQSQFEVLRQQVNPHFLFNSLNVLTSLIKLEPDLAEKFTEHLSKVYRYVLENKDNDLVSLHTELEFLDAYIFLLHIRFMDKIDIRVNIDASGRDKMILPLALQLLIENAIKHNSMSKKNPLIIDIFITGGNLLNVVNNLQERESYMASTGVGLRNIEHRYALLEMPAPKFTKNETQFIASIPLKG